MSHAPTQEMNDAFRGKIPKTLSHAPELQDDNGKTVATYIANIGEIPGEIFHHDPELKDGFGNTVAHILAYKSILPPKEWEHKADM